ncbi:hypothetical protein K9L97_00170 [Candidatus Woesearchaeota archaeon]|nr:hypothetical protein [Candidatus Woesearchaeota archaeon]
MNTTEELDSYIEMDIIQFLDKISEASQIGDYTSEKQLQELQKALNIKDTLSAINTTQEAIQEFNQTNQTDPYKQIRLIKIQEISETLTEYCKKNKDSQKLCKIAEMLKDELEIKKDKTETIDILQKLEQEKQEKQNQKQEKYYQIKTQLNKKLTILKEIMTTNLLKRNIPQAINAYKKMKIIFTRYPSIYLEEKKELYNDLISYYMQIKKTMKYIKEKEKRDKIIKKQNEEKQQIKIQQIHLQQIANTIQEIKEDAKQGRLDDAKNKIIELKRINSQIPNKYTTIKETLNNKINLINERIEFIKRFRQTKTLNETQKTQQITS